MSVSYTHLDVYKRQGWYSGERVLFTKASRVCRAVGAVLMFVPPVISILLSSLLSLELLTLVGLVPLLLLFIVGLMMVMMTFDRRDSMKKSKRTTMFVIGSVLIAIGILIAAGLTAYLLKSEILAVLVAASTIVTYVFVLLMKARTKNSAQLQGKILGFKDFIEAAELEKLKLLVDENPEYFYDIMPYAYVMGLSDKCCLLYTSIALISDLLTDFITPKTGTGIMTLLSGLLATVTSSSGVVMPTLIPVSASIAENLSGVSAGA